jgi:hypothetical protein
MRLGKIEPDSLLLDDEAGEPVGLGGVRARAFQASSVMAWPI